MSPARTPPARVGSAALCALAALGSLACTAPTEHDDLPPLSIEGLVDAPIVDLPGRPFGIRVASSGAIFVTHQDNNRVTRVPPGDVGARDLSTVGADPGDVVLTADGTTAIVSTFIDGDLHFLSTATGDETDFTSIGANAYRLLLSSSGSALFVTTTGGMVYSVSVATGEKTDSVMVGGSLQGIARRADGRVAVSSSSGAITLLDPATLDVITDEWLGVVAQDVVFSTDGLTLFVAAEDAASVIVLDGTTLAPLDTISFPGPTAIAPFGLAISPDGTTLLVGSALSGSLAIVDAATHAVRKSLTFGGTPRRIAFNPAGTRAYIANEANRVDVIR